MDSILEQLVQLVRAKKQEVYNTNIGQVPTVYYIGMGKTGSGSIVTSLPDHQTAHWHEEHYFEVIYKTNLLTANKITLLDFVIYASRYTSQKPLIVESLREPISRAISDRFQCWHQDAFNPSYHSGNRQNPHHLPTMEEGLNLENYRFVFPYYAPAWKRFGVDVKAEFDTQKKYFYTELPEVKLLLIRYEDIADRPLLFQSLGYRYNPSRWNIAKDRPVSGPIYEQVVNQIRVPPEQFMRAFYKTDAHFFYSEEEIAKLKQRWTRKKPLFC